ncbi:hypothetical protein FIBSPDRAFT_917852 [Athelia psychrophila]|uniref:RING-14 protein n=1 Tax=Athelia psychrophila TaxID=1759441 RepID=A0A166QYR4_9AGAM|nr:hypothetical protein FIBSPDRAFT_917852 [Fibularhizoctonia sp. CBS 109695]
MHFSKTYTQLLLSLPPELREHAIEYRQLKKLINKVVNELESLGLQPSVLQELLTSGDEPTAEGDAISLLETISSSASICKAPRAVYEFSSASPESIQPQLRLWVKGHQSGPIDFSSSAVSLIPTGNEDDANQIHLVSPSALAYDEEAREVIIPLNSDMAFFQVLSKTLQSTSDQLITAQKKFTHTLEQLSRNVSLTARPISSTTSFHPHSAVSNQLTIKATSFGFGAKSDLYTWRELFQLYVDSEVFESVSEVHRGERTVEDSEARLQAFTERVTTRGLAKKLKLRPSHAALEMFMDLNIFILNVKKFQYGNAEATRKILKKHAKRTALPFPTSLDSNNTLAVLPRASTSLPRILVQAIGETLLPIIPHVDDYACLICTSIAFKPIRLFCGHLFCVRCLVKMQKRGQGDCPMCRAPTVITADRSNVDWALLNFMQDWFPIEAKEKLKSNEREAAEEELRELGYDTKGCTIA